MIAKSQESSFKQLLNENNDLTNIPPVKRCRYSFPCCCKITTISIIILLVTVVTAFLIYAYTPFGDHNDPLVLQALQSDDNVAVYNLDDKVAFNPYVYKNGSVKARSSTSSFCAFLFYPGGRVYFKSYSPVLRQVAIQGNCLVVVPSVLFNLAFFDINAVDKFKQPHGLDFAGVTSNMSFKWFVGGHSLGGIAASLYVSSYNSVSDRVEPYTGIIFYASYPSLSLTTLTHPLKGIIIYGTLDLTPVSEYNDKKSLMPPNSTYVEIQGGNHGQFGNYGLQPGDATATISRNDQQAIIYNSTAIFLLQYT